MALSPTHQTRSNQPKTHTQKPEALKQQMKISSTISSLSSLTPYNSSTAGVIETSALPPLLPIPSPPTQVEFWYDDEEDEDEDEKLPMAAINFLEECGMCKRQLGPGRDTYMCGGESVFCSEDCRSAWMEMKEVSDEENHRRRTVAMIKRIHGGAAGERRDLQKKPCYSFSTDPAVEICRSGTLVAG